MEQSSSEVSIGIFGHYGNENLGDEAIIEAMVQNIRKHCPSAIIYGFSINPTDTQKRYGITAYPIRQISGRTNVVMDSVASPSNLGPQRAKRSIEEPFSSRIKNLVKGIPILGVLLRQLFYLPQLGQRFISELHFLKQSYENVQKLDVLMVTGSNQFLDNFGGTWGFPYTLLKWTFLAKLAGKKVLYVSVGAGPLTSKWSKRLIRMALSMSDFISFRDTASLEMIRASGFKGEGHVFPDLAHSLVSQQYESKYNLSERSVEKPTVAINPMPVYDSRYWCEPDDKKYHEYVQKLAEFSYILLRDGYPVRFFSTQPKDEYVISDILSLLQKDKNINVSGITISPRTVEDLMEGLSQVDIAITTRFHGTLLALLAEKPVLGVCYYRKTDDLMRKMGQGDYSLDLDDFKVSEMLEKFLDLERKRMKEIERIKSKNELFREALDKQYAMLFDVIKAR